MPKQVKNNLDAIIVHKISFYWHKLSLRNSEFKRNSTGINWFKMNFIVLIAMSLPLRNLMYAAPSAGVRSSTSLHIQVTEPNICAINKFPSMRGSEEKILFLEHEPLLLPDSTAGMTASYSPCSGIARHFKKYFFPFSNYNLSFLKFIPLIYFQICVHKTQKVFAKIFHHHFLRRETFQEYLRLRKTFFN